MKIIGVLLSFIVIFFLSSCKNDFGEQTDMIYNEGIYFNKNWDEEIGSYKKDVIPDKETAIAVAIQIFNGMEKSENATNFVPKSVFFDESDEIWIVSFASNNDEEGMDCCIAIQKKDGKVIRIWYGE